MTMCDNRYADLLEEAGDPARARLIADLDAAYNVAPPLEVRASIGRALDERARSRARQHRYARPGARVQATGRARWASVAATLALVVGGLLGYLHVEAPTPASAAMILRRAIAARPAATVDQILHQTGTLYVDGPFDLPDQHLFTPPETLTVDQWTQLDATGAISRQVTTLTTGPSGALVARGLQIGRNAQVYGTRENAISTETAAPDQTYAWLANPLGIADVPGLLAAAQTSSTDQLRLLPPRTLDGSQVNVVQIRTSPDLGTVDFPHPVGSVRGAAQLTTMYIDAGTYAIRGVNVVAQQASGASSLTYSMRVAASSLVPRDTVADATFTLAAPAGARSLPAPRPTPAPPHPAQPTPFLVLAHAPAGLQLGQFGRDIGSLFASASISYCGGTARCSEQPANSPRFVVSFAQTQPPTAHVPPMLATGQPLLLTIAGQPVQAYYLDEAAPLGARRLIYQQGTTTVELYSQGLGKAAFFAAVGDLVDLRTHPDLIPEKWRQLGVLDPAR